MPMKVNVGLSRKVGEPNYSSRGASVSVELELEAELVHQPDQLQGRIRQLFVVARDSIREELNGDRGHAGHSGHDEDRDHYQNGSSRARGSSERDDRPATESQVRALHAIARRKRLDLPGFLRERFRVARPEDLSLPEASDLIDEFNGGSRR